MFYINIILLCSLQ